MRRLLSVVLLTLPLAAWAQSPPLTETEAVRLGLARADFSDLERGAVEAAEAEAQAVGLPPNPTLSYTRDRVQGGSGATEETWLVAQTFDLSGRRGLRRDAAGRRIEAAGAGNGARRVEGAAEIRRSFHRVLLKQEAVRATDAWTRRFGQVEAIVQKLAGAGEASGYDRRRLARERQAANARLASETADLERARERLAALTGRPAGLAGDVAGVLLPPPPDSLETALARLERRPDFEALARRAEAADLDGRAAARGWVPDVTLGIGPKRIDNGITRESGYEFTVSIPLPVFDRQQPGERRAAADALVARSEYRLARARAEGDLRGLLLQIERLRAAAIDFRATAVAATPELLRIAEIAYQGGEATLLELLDAYRGALDAETTALDLEWRAREARIEYDLLTGSAAE